MQKNPWKHGQALILGQIEAPSHNSNMCQNSLFSTFELHDLKDKMICSVNADFHLQLA